MPVSVKTNVTEFATKNMHPKFDLLYTGNILWEKILIQVKAIGEVKFGE